MTGKLMKYELRGCMRIFLPLWAAVLVLSVINGLTNGNQATVSGVLPRIILFVLPAVALGVLLIGMFAVALVIIVRRFYHGLLGEGGYFAFSLPATTSQQIFARLFTSCLMQLGCFLTAFLSAVIIFSIQAKNPILGELKTFLNVAVTVLKRYPHTTLLAIEGIVLVLLVISATILRLYSAMAIGHLSASHRVWLSVGAYLVMGWIIGYGFGKLGVSMVRVLGDADLNIIVSAETASESISNCMKVSGIVIVILLAENVILWLITHLILKKKLNIL